MTDLEELRQLANATRIFIENSHNRVWALQAVVYGHDVIFGIYPNSEGFGIHVIKGDAIFREIVHHRTHIDYSHTDLSPKVHPAMGGIPFSFEPVRLGDATGRVAEPSTQRSVPSCCIADAVSLA